MLPGDGQLASTARHAAFNDPVRGPVEYLHDYERAGAALYDGTKGMQVKVWEGRVVDKVTVQVSAPGVPWTSLFTRTNDLSEISIAFDNNMFPFVTFIEADGSAWIYWYDSSDSTQKFTQLPAGVVSPRCCVDDHRPSQNANSDVVLSYLRGGSLYVRYQRNRYGTEHLMQAGLGADARLVDVGMNRVWRLQFWLRNANHVAGAAVFEDPFLGDVVSALLRRSEIPPQRADVSALYEDTVMGFKVATEAGAGVLIEPLRMAHFFDAGEWDKKLRFPKRGGAPVARITADDLVERDGPAMDLTRVQEAELLRKVNVISIDPAAGYTTTKQTAERRSGLIRATGEASMELPMTISADGSATVAMRRLKVAWGELHKAGLSLGMPWSALTPTDVIEVTDKRGRVLRMRVVEVQEDSGVLELDLAEDAPWAYDAAAVGAVVQPPESTTPGLVGNTVLAVLNIPVLRDQDDELGYYVGVVGTGTGWRGGIVEMSTDGGATLAASIAFDVPSVIGATVTPLSAEVSGEYLSRQTLRVTLPSPPESISYEALLRYNNRAVIRRTGGQCELLQFQTVTPVDAVTFDLSGLVRGRYATASDAVPAGAEFVLIDDSLAFVQLQQWMLGQTLSVRAISAGQDADAVPWSDVLIDGAASQTEWPVHHVRAIRDGSDAVTVNWIGRARLGVETAPRHSRYFGGYRVIYSDGITADTATTTHTRASTPPGVTVQVAPLNTITGQGPASEAIPT